MAGLYLRVGTTVLEETVLEGRQYLLLEGRMNFTAGSLEGWHYH